MIRMISSFLFLFCFSTSLFAEYYLVYSSPCAHCYKLKFKKVRHIFHHKKYRANYCKPRSAIHYAQRVYSVPKRYGSWIPGYWLNGHWIPPKRVKSISTRHHYRSHYLKEEYYLNLDLTTGDDNPYVDPELNIDR